MKANELSAKDLMIGDWVNYRGICNRIAPADFCHFEWIDEIRPIPLTSEILEKNGFERTWQDNFVYNNEDIGLIITFHPKETNYTNGTYDYIDIEKGCVTITEMPIEFVHQLQHVLRLCEVSIEIIEL